MKKSILYISPEYFSDTDFPVLEELHNIYNLHWIVVFDTLNIRKFKFSTQDVELFAKNNNISYEILIRKYRRRHPLNIFFNIKLWLKISKFKCDVIYIETLSDIYFSLLAIFFSNRKKTILAIHDVIAHVTHKKKISDVIINIADNILPSHFSNIQLFSNAQADIFANKFKGKKIFVVPFFLKKINDVQELLPVKTEKFNFLFWGTIRDNKGLDFLILAAEKLYTSGFRNFKVIIVGKASEQGWQVYSQLIKHPEIFELHISSEYIPIEDVPQFFAMSQFLVLPYRDVTQSGPLLYAYNYTLPIIASNLEGFREYINDGENGFLFKPEDVESLYNIMKTVLSISDTQITQIKSNLKAFVKANISNEAIVAKYRDMFEEV